MNCSNHPDGAVAAYCRTCGKPLCSNCTRDVRGVTYCESCLAARMEGQASAPQQTVYQQVMDQGMGLQVQPLPAQGPHPVLAGLLAGFFPFGVGAVYCGQYAKGLAHLLIFVMLVYGADHSGSMDFLFGIGIAFFYIYQIIDAVKTAHAVQAGRPAPDPMGLGNMFGEGWKSENRNIPSGAVVLIGLGALFLLHTMGIFEYGFERFWPLILVGLGGWMLVKQKNRASLTGPIMVLTTGLILLLSTMDIAEIGKTWPAWILAAGVAQLLRGKPGDSAGPLPPPVPPPAAPGETTSSSSSEVHHG
jgi:Domain of unknown function (DUF5668)/B-box zinc finger